MRSLELQQKIMYIGIYERKNEVVPFFLSVGSFYLRTRGWMGPEEMDCGPGRRWSPDLHETATPLWDPHKDDLYRLR